MKSTRWPIICRQSQLMPVLHDTHWLVGVADEAHVEEDFLWLQLARGGPLLPRVLQESLGVAPHNKAALLLIVLCHLCCWLVQPVEGMATG